MAPAPSWMQPAQQTAFNSAQGYLAGGPGQTANPLVNAMVAQANANVANSPGGQLYAYNKAGVPDPNLLPSGSTWQPPGTQGPYTGATYGAGKGAFTAYPGQTPADFAGLGLMAQQAIYDQGGSVAMTGFAGLPFDRGQYQQLAGTQDPASQWAQYDRIGGLPAGSSQPLGQNHAADANGVMRAVPTQNSFFDASGKAQPSQPPTQQQVVVAGGNYGYPPAGTAPAQPQAPAQKNGAPASVPAPNHLLNSLSAGAQNNAGSIGLGARPKRAAATGATS